VRAWLSRYSFQLRLALSTGLMVLIFYAIDLGRMARILAGARLEFVLLAIAIIVLERVVMAFKWQLLLAAKSVAVTLPRMLKIVYLGNFIGTFLPSSLGVDVVRSYSLYRHGAALSESVSSVVVDKVLSLLAAMVVPLTVVLLFPGIVADPAVRGAVIVIAVGFGAVLLLSLHRRLVHGVLRLGRRLPGLLAADAVWGRAETLYNAFHAYTAYKGTLAQAFLASLVFQALRVLGVIALGVALGLELGLLAYLVFVPLVIMLTMLPISVGGIGVREGAFVYFFTGAGVPAEGALALSLLLYLVSLLSVLPGGVIYLRDGMGLRSAADSGQQQPGEPREGERDAEGQADPGEPEQAGAGTGGERHVRAGHGA
jgi:glycosyltransferase 2 family protein